MVSTYTSVIPGAVDHSGPIYIIPLLDSVGCGGIGGVNWLLYIVFGICISSTRRGQPPTNQTHPITLSGGRCVLEEVIHLSSEDLRVGTSDYRRMSFFVMETQEAESGYDRVLLREEAGQRRGQ